MYMREHFKDHSLNGLASQEAWPSLEAVKVMSTIRWNNVVLEAEESKAKEMITCSHRLN